MTQSIDEIVIKGAWVLVSFVSFIFLSIISQQLLDPFYPTFVSSTPGNIYTCGLLFFLISVCCSILTYFHFLIKDGPIGILINVLSASLFCFCAISFSICFGTKLFHIKADSKVYQSSIISCNTESILCDQFKQTIGDIAMPNKQLQGLVTDYVQKRTFKAATITLFIMASWIITHSLFLNFLYHKDENALKEYNKAQVEEHDHISDDFENMPAVEKETFN